jgi:hypothetical protein
MSTVNENPNYSLGQQIVNDFKNAIIMRSTAEYAKEEAARSENETVKGIDAISRGAYLNPGVVPADIQEQITRASVDAHIKKVQANQLSQTSKGQIMEMQINAEKNYKSKNVKITVLMRDEKPIESIWLDPRSNQYYPGILNTKSISGKIEEILLNKNSVMIKPNFLSRVSANNRKFFLVYVINPKNLEPMVKFDF